MVTPLDSSPAYRVCSFESRRKDEMSRLVERHHGIPTNAPSMREIPLSDNAAAFEFATQLLESKTSIVIFMTGIGTEALFAALETKELVNQVRAGLRGNLVVARGPKPAAALAKLNVRVDLRVPEPNTWEELISEFQRQRVLLTDQMVAVQEYGAPSTELYNWLAAQGAKVLPVPVYQWGLPEDLEPLKRAIDSTLAGEFDVLLWTSAQQLNHVLEVADQLGLRQKWLQAANQCVVGSIGPTASERLRKLGLPPDIEPSRPKMAHLVIETLQQTRDLLRQKSDLPRR